MYLDYKHARNYFLSEEFEIEYLLLLLTFQKYPFFNHLRCHWIHMMFLWLFARHLWSKVPCLSTITTVLPHFWVAFDSSGMKEHKQWLKNTLAHVRRWIVHSEVQHMMT